MNRDRQIEREQRLSEDAYDRAVSLYQKQVNNGAGGASSASASVMGKYIPLAEAGLLGVEGHLRLMEVINELGRRQCIAIAIRCSLDSLLQRTWINRSTLFTTIAEALDNEAIIGSFTRANPMRANLLHQRASKEMAGRAKKVRMFLTSSEVTGDTVLRINRELGVQIAGVAVGCLIGAGMLHEDMEKKGKRTLTYVSLTSECLDMVAAGNVASFDHFSTAAAMLCEPDDWGKGKPGGYLTHGMKEVHRLVLGPRNLTKALRDVSMPQVYDAINRLQKTPWRVSKRILGVVTALAGSGRMAELVPDVKITIPEYPAHLEGIPPESRTPEQAEEHDIWRTVAREAWKLKRKEEASALRYVRILEDAQTLKDEDRFYFVWAMDSRGRMYPRVYGMSPQGSDLQKALLEFADGFPIENDIQLVLFKNNLAHRWGFDKASYADTMVWFRENEPLILAHANDPLNNDEWMQADSPLLYLQAAMEYSEYLKDPEGFRSHIPIAADGACSGQQHMSAILLDPVAAEATNLRKGPTRHDLYGQVGKATEARISSLRASGELPDVLAPFLSFGIPRALVKRPTMTLPYGLTKRSVPPYLVSDYLVDHEVPGLAKDDIWKAGKALGDVVWLALGDTLDSTMKMLQWLRKAVSEGIRGLEGTTVSWTTPDGFKAQQRYPNFKEDRIRTWCYGDVKVAWAVECPTGNKVRHRQSFPPNFIHSLDATHMRKTINALGGQGCKHFAMIHDDFGCPVSFADKLWHIVREQFHRQYTDTDVMKDLCAEWGLQLEPMPRGSLDLSEVLTAEYAFK